MPLPSVVRRVGGSSWRSPGAALIGATGYQPLLVAWPPAYHPPRPPTKFARAVLGADRLGFGEWLIGGWRNVGSIRGRPRPALGSRNAVLGDRSVAESPG